MILLGKVDERDGEWEESWLYEGKKEANNTLIGGLYSLLAAASPTELLGESQVTRRVIAINLPQPYGRSLAKRGICRWREARARAYLF